METSHNMETITVKFIPNLSTMSDSFQRFTIKSQSVERFHQWHVKSPRMRVPFMSTFTKMNRIKLVLVQILSVYWSLGLTSTRLLKSRAVTVYLLQERSTNTKTPVDTRTVQAGLGPSYPVHCVYIMGVVKLPNSK